jgi:hypothetical protein
MVNVTLTPHEMALAAQAGARREIQAAMRARKEAHGHDAARPWIDHIEGACAELAVAKVSDHYWRPVVDEPLHTLQQDVGQSGRVQVRSTPRANGALILHLNDDPEARFLLVVGARGTYQIVGWIRGADGMANTFWRDPGTGRPAFFIPQPVLLPLNTPAEVAALWAEEPQRIEPKPVQGSLFREGAP